MSDFLMREEFEAAIISEFKSTGLGDGPDLRRSENNGDYLNQVVGGAWWAWNVSREYLVIELPKPYAWDNDGGFEREHDPESECSMALIPKIDAMQAIHAAGVKTK